MRKLFLQFKSNLTKGFIVPLSFVLLSLSFISLTNAQDLDNKGDDFIMAFMPNLGSSTTELHLTSDVATNVTVEYPVNLPSFSTTVAVTPGSITIVSIPATSASGWPIGAVGNNAVHAFAPDEFICYMTNILGFTSDAALGLPIDVMNTEFIILSYEGAFHGSDRSQFVVYAGFDATTVTITPSVNMKGGFPAGVPFNIILNKGEGFLAQSLANSGPTADLTGTLISSDRPVGVTNGNQCGNVPPGNTACDHMFEVAQPVQTWGDQIVDCKSAESPIRDSLQDDCF